VVRGEDVVGIVSRANLVHALAGLARDVTPTAASDEAIADRIMGAGRQAWAPTASQRHRQGRRGGALGTITDERERQAIIVAAENAPGARSRIIWPGSMRCPRHAHLSIG
jgi:hypothetical protein